MISDNAKYWIWLTQTLGYNQPKIEKLYRLYPNIADFYEGGEKEWRLSGVLNSNDLKKLDSADINVSKPILQQCDSYGYSVISIDDDFYPDKLRHIYAPPAVLYVQGKTNIFDDRLVIAIVGTRTASSYGTTNAYRFAYAFGKCDVATVSGGALGVDCAAHRGSLAAHGVTICVRGCGINYNYLPDNARMRQAITNDGAVISEYPPDTEPRPHHFPARNRIIAGLCDGLILMESGKKSGSLITANLALEMGKEVFALLGNNSPRNMGSNDRIKEGTAYPVTDFMDVLAAFEKRSIKRSAVDFDDICLADIEAIPVKRSRAVKKQQNNNNLDDIKPTPPVFPQEEEPKEPQKTVPVHKKDVDLTEVQQKVYDYLSDKPVHIDAISKNLNIPVFKVLGSLTVLEIKGLAQAHPGRNFSLK